MGKLFFIILLTLFVIPGYARAENSTLIMCYSKTGRNRIIAQELKSLIPSATLIEIKADVSILKAIFWHQLFNRNAKIEPIDVDLTQYNRIIICSPIWMQKISSPVRTVINTLPFQGKQLQLFVTYAGYFGKWGQNGVKRYISSKGINLIKLGLQGLLYKKLVI